MKKMMSRPASAEREKRATITKAAGDREASDNLAAAAKTMAASPGAMQLRALQAIDGLGPTASNTIVLAVPIDIMDAVRSIKGERHRRNNGRTLPVFTELPDTTPPSIGPLDSAAAIRNAL
jgi:hypothetical protein